MTRITEIVPDPGTVERVVVIADGNIVASIPRDRLDALGIRVGADLAAVAPMVVDEEARRRTHDRALRLLASRARSTSELRASLLRKGEQAEHVDSAIERLTTSGLLDDVRFAREFVRFRCSRYSARRLARELHSRGVALPVARTAIREVLLDEEVDEDHALAVLVRKKLRTLATVDAATRRRRLHAYLLRRGYTAAQIHAAMRRVDVHEAGDEGRP